MKAAPLFSLLLLAACGSAKHGGGGGGQASDPLIPAPAASADASDDRIDCAIAGGQFAHACTVERTSGKDGLMLTVRAPSGSFRRLEVTGDGRGVIAADGAEPAKVTILGPGRIEVAIGGDRYRLPATVRQ
ncbi:MAG TPA: hypothetical protein VKI45_01975 [Allosphingosinicella sp.]|nr:hypothetical protein [Allosphingosinicella sp.]